MHRPIFRFRNFRLDPATRQLWRDGALVPLPLKSLECLAYLAEHRDRAVGRDELIATVWGRAEVSDALLGQTLLRARRAVDDDGGENVTIRTIVRFGYHWVAPVEVDDVAAGPASASRIEPKPEAVAVANAAMLPGVHIDASRHADTSGRLFRSRSKPIILVILIGLITVIAASAFVLWHRSSAPFPQGAAAHGNLVLVLPVAGVDAGGDQSWVRLGAMEYLASRLRGTRELQVLPSEQTVALLGGDNAVDPREVSDLYRFQQTTGATYIMAPRATYTGHRVRI